MTEEQPTTNTVNWKYNFGVAVLFAVIVVLTSFYHSFSGLPIRWSDPPMVFATVFGLLTFCDFGRSWRYHPLYILFAGGLLLGTIRTTLDSLLIWERSGDLWAAAENTGAGIRTAFTLVLLLYVYIKLMKYLYRFQPACQDKTPCSKA